jgi:hypothetical protein
VSERFRAPDQLSRAEVVLEELRELHRRIAVELGHDEEKAPTWFAHVPGMGPIPIRYIGVWRGFVRFTGFAADETTCDYVLVRPDNVMVSIATLPPEQEPKPFLGFTTDESPG